MYVKNYTDMKVIWLWDIILLKTGVDLAEEQKMGHLFIHSGKILNKYLYLLVAFQALGTGGVMVKLDTDKKSYAEDDHYHKLVLSPWIIVS